MSYSLGARGATKHEAKQKALAALATQMASMAAHSRDAAAAHASISAHVDACDEPNASHDLVVEAHGSLSGGYADGSPCTGAQHGVRVYHAPKSTQA